MNRTLARLERPDLMAKQITKLFETAEPAEITEGAAWYIQAHEIAKLLAHKFSQPLPKVAGVMAALSPATNWQQNVADTHNLLLAWVHGVNPNEVVVTTYGGNKLKAIRILRLQSSNYRDIEALLLHKSRVNKTTCFFLNILFPDNDEVVTVDRHAIRIALGNPKGVDDICMTEKRYRTISEAYQIAAKGLDINAVALQAVVWCVFRRKQNIAAANIENEIYNEVINQI
jgi:hypothetical protein